MDSYTHFCLLRDTHDMERNAPRFTEREAFDRALRTHPLVNTQKFRDALDLYATSEGEARAVAYSDLLKVIDEWYAK